MDLTEEYKNIEWSEQPISNAEIYKLQEFYSDIRYVPPEIVYRGFPTNNSPSLKHKSLFDTVKLRMLCVPYCIVKVEYN